MIIPRWFQVGVCVTIFVLVCIWVYRNRDTFELKCIVSSVDGEKYCVRDTRRQQESADLLADATERMQRLVTHLTEKFPDNAAVQRLHAGFNARDISEILPNSEFVAYSENKSKMSFCLTEKKNGSQLIDINTLMFVAIHELSHIATKSIGHKQEFWDNFKFLLVEAEKIKIYSPEDYKTRPIEFCSMKINDNPYFDM